ncbi:hypothetical protein, partial [Bradyrhizobium cosmicum]|uniref:hypothetical protein n=1 Tax=Bradyrhizobium cosmicum TaxID=1404864 RepID=UPI0028F00A84
MPASQLSRLLPSLAAALATFGVAARTGMNAFSYLGNSSHHKVGAYEAVVRSNANIAYCYTREIANLVAHVFQLVSHDALLTGRGWAASSVEYGFSFAAQQRVLSAIGQDRGFDLSWPAISAAAEAVDVAFTSAAARLAEPGRPVELWRGRLAEGTSAEADPPLRPTVIDAIDRLTQRAVGRQLVGDIGSSSPALAAGTHLRELTWQAERASRGSGASTVPSDPEAPPVGVSPNGGSSSGLQPPWQEGTELSSPGDLYSTPPDVAGSSSSAEAASSFVDRSLGEFGRLVGMGWEHGRQRAPHLLVCALDDRFHEFGGHGTGRLFVDSSFAIE